tara:strand:+ start:1197 stop:1673 length:477 start_codon:yes stop_codon:yes gene_type:complete
MVKPDPEALSERASQKSRTLINYRLRSEYELRTRLAEHFEEETIDIAISQMYSEGLLDDTRFTNWFVETKTHSRPISSRMIQRQLIRIGIKPDLAKSATSGVNDNENALQVAIKRSRATAHLPKNEFQRKMSQHLARRGFSFEATSNAIKKSWALISE